MKKIKKILDGYPNLLLILQVCASFHHNQTKDNYFFWMNGPLNLIVQNHGLNGPVLAKNIFLSHDDIWLLPWKFMNMYELYSWRKTSYDKITIYLINIYRQFNDICHTSAVPCHGNDSSHKIALAYDQVVARAKLCFFYKL